MSKIFIHNKILIVTLLISFNIIPKSGATFGTE